MNQNQNESYRACILNAIDKTYDLKCFIESVMYHLGEPNEIEKIQEIKQKADHAEKEIEENISRLIKFTAKKSFPTPKSITSNYSERSLKETRKSARIFERYFKHYSSIYNLIEKPSTQPIDVRKSLEDMKTSIQKRKIIKGIEFFDYAKKRNFYEIRIKFNLGIELIIKSTTGIIDSYYFLLLRESINLKQLLSLLEATWEYSLSSLDRSILKCINKAAAWIDNHKRIFTEKCKICDMHLNFKNGVPMLPLITFQNSYYHVDCYFDLQISSGITKVSDSSFLYSSYN